MDDNCIDVAVPTCSDKVDFSVRGKLETGALSYLDVEHISKIIMGKRVRTLSENDRYNMEDSYPLITEIINCQYQRISSSLIPVSISQFIKINGQFLQFFYQRFTMP